MKTMQNLLEMLEIGTNRLNDRNQSGEKIRAAVMFPFVTRRRLKEREVAKILVREGIAKDNHNAIYQLKSLADNGGILCNCAGYLAVTRENGSYTFHYRVPSDVEREKGYK